jgi:hypothetical protein
MEYTNLDKLVAVITEWLRPLASTLAGAYLNKLDSVERANAWARKFFPVSADYSIANDLGFLFMPTLQSAVRPFIQSSLDKLNLTDDAIPEFAKNTVMAMDKELETKPTISLFNLIELDADDVNRLRHLLENNLNVSFTGYTVVK